MKKTSPETHFHANLFPLRSDVDIEYQSKMTESNFSVLITCSNEQGSESILIQGERLAPVRPSDFVQAPKERRLSDSEKFRARIYRAYISLGYSFLAVLMAFSILSFGGVVKARVVLTESMEPLISPGDVVITTPISRKEPVIGDVVTYVAKRFDGSPVGTFTHRIIDGDKESGFVVKGDNNPAPDVQRPKYEDIAGVLLFTIPFIGTLMTPRSLAILIPTLFGIWLVVDALRKND